MQIDTHFLIAWLDQRAEAMNACLTRGFAEEALVLIYSGIDTLAFLDAPAETKQVKQKHFINWCDQYLGPCLDSGIRGIDLYGARCGLLHISSAKSRLGSEGKAREIYYRFRGKVGVNLMANTPEIYLLLDIEKLAAAFQTASQRFAADIKHNEQKLPLAQERVRQFFCWVTPAPPSS